MVNLLGLNDLSNDAAKATITSYTRQWTELSVIQVMA